MHEDRLDHDLARRHLSRTAPRRQVYRELYAEGPCTIAALLAQLNGQVSRRTVYDTLRLFTIEAAIAKFDHGRLLQLAGHTLELTGLCGSCVLALSTTS